MSDTQSDTPQMYPSNVFACPISCQTGDVDNNNAQVTEVWNISPRTINEARIGFTSQLNFFKDLALNRGYASQLGWQFAKADDFPAINFTGGSYPYAWIDPSSNSVYKEFTWDPSDVVTMIRGKHILHFGGELLAYQNNSTAWGNTNAGTFSFTGNYTQQWALDANGVAGPVAGTGMEYADFLLGYAQSWNAGISPEYGARLKTPQVFVQDDWKVRPNLTLNLGLRYQINHGWNEVHQNMSSFDPTVLNPANNSLGAYWFGPTKANGRTSLQANTFNTWQPRLGLAWAIDPKTTLRGGFGVYSYTWSLDTYGGNNTNYGMGARSVRPVAAPTRPVASPQSQSSMERATTLERLLRCRLFRHRPLPMRTTAKSGLHPISHSRTQNSAMEHVGAACVRHELCRGSCLCGEPRVEPEFPYGSQPDTAAVSIAQRFAAISPLSELQEHPGKHE